MFPHLQYILATKDGTKLATLRRTSRVDVEMFWFAFDFEPTPEFEKHRMLFDQWASIEYDENPDLANSILDQMNVQFQLIPVGDAPPATDFSIFIEGDIAVMRCVLGDTPLTKTRLDEKPAWELRKQEDTLGTLIETDSDAFYKYCQFHATSAFANFAQLFEDELNTLKADDDAWTKLVKQIQDMRLKLVPMNSITSAIKIDILHINGEKAWFRAIHEE